MNDIVRSYQWSYLPWMQIKLKLASVSKLNCCHQMKHKWLSTDKHFSNFAKWPMWMAGMMLQSLLAPCVGVYHYCQCQYESITSHVSWNIRCCQLITSYLILMCDLSRLLPHCHCLYQCQHHSIITNISIKA